MAFFKELTEKIQKGTEFAKKSTEFAIKHAEKSLKVEAVKVDISALKKELDKKMTALALKAYSLYESNALENEEAVELCKSIKTLHWQIDEKWNEVEVIKNEPTKIEEKENKESQSESVSIKEDPETESDENV